jgi:hypothetical protein
MTSLSFDSALASHLLHTILLAIPISTSSHSFWALRPPGFPVALCYTPHLSILHLHYSNLLVTASVQSFNVPRVSFVGFGRWPYNHFRVC